MEQRDETGSADSSVNAGVEVCLREEQKQRAHAAELVSRLSCLLPSLDHAHTDPAIHIINDNLLQCCMNESTACPHQGSM